MAITLERFGRIFFGFAARLSLAGDVDAHLSAIDLRLDCANAHGAFFKVRYARPVPSALAEGWIGDDRLAASIGPGDRLFGCHILFRDGKVDDFEIYRLGDADLPETIEDFRLDLVPDRTWLEQVPS